MAGQAAAKSFDKGAAKVDDRSPELAHSRRAVGPYAEVMALQRMAGNGAVTALLQGSGESAAKPASTGQPLDVATRVEMEQRFGHDFSQVRVHTDTSAAKAAAGVSAKAYTIGSDLVFGEGHYAPETHEGRQLLAHELAHVVQQSRGGAAPALDPGSSLEQAASTAAAQAMQGSGPVAVAGASSAGMARAEDDQLTRALRDLDAAQRAGHRPKQEPFRDLAAYSASLSPVGTPPQRGGGTPVSVAPAQSNAHSFVDPALAQKRAVQTQPAAQAAPTSTPAAPKGQPARGAPPQWAIDYARGMQAEHEQHAKDYGFGGSNLTEKQARLQGSPVYEAQKGLERGATSPGQVLQFKAAIASMSFEDYKKLMPQATLDDFMKMKDLATVEGRRWQNYIAPPPDVDGIIRKALRLDSKAYISQDYLDYLAYQVANNQAELAKAGISPEENGKLNSFFRTTERQAPTVDEDPYIAAGPFASIRTSQFRQYQAGQALAGIQMLAQSPAASVFYVGASVFTDDESTRMAVAGLGASLEGVAIGIASVGSGRAQVQAVAAYQPGPMNQVTMMAPKRGAPPPVKGPAGSAGAEAIDLAREAPLENAPALGEGGIVIAPPTPITQAKGSRGLPPKLQAWQPGQGGVTSLKGRQPRGTSGGTPDAEAQAQPQAQVLARTGTDDAPVAAVAPNQPGRETGPRQGDQAVAAADRGRGGQPSVVRSIAGSGPGQRTDAPAGRTAAMSPKPSPGSAREGRTDDQGAAGQAGVKAAPPADASSADRPAPAITPHTPGKPTIARFGQDEVNELVGYWTRKAEVTTDPALKRTYQGNISRLTSRGRLRGGEQSEEEIAHLYSLIGGRGETGYFAGRQVPNPVGKKGVTKPDFVITPALGEVKNWTVDYPEPELAERLLQGLENQIAARRAQGPVNIKQQTVVLDVRGQKLSEQQLQLLGQTVARRTGLPIEHIQIVTWGPSAVQ